MKQLISGLLFSLITAFIAVTPVSAGDKTSNCQPIYGGGETCKPAIDIIIDKKVIHPTKNMAVDNLGVNDPKFKPGQEVRFSISVRNTGDIAITDLELADTMADFLEVTEGNVEFSEEDGEFFYTIDRIEPGETIVFELSTIVFPVEELPADEAILCVTNRAAVAFGDQLAEDTANFCIEKEVIVTPKTKVVTPGKTVVQLPPSKGGQQIVTKGGQPVAPNVPGESIVIPPTTKGGQPVYPVPTTTKTVPQTGPELLGLIGLLPTAGAGLFLRRKTK